MSTSPTTSRPSREEVLRQHAVVASLRSTCSRGQVGAVVSRHGRILVTGYNGAPAGMPHCDHTCNCGYPGIEGLMFANTHLSDCASLAPCTVSLHAEENCIAYAARWGISLEGGEMDTTDSPCMNCARLIINTGIKRVRYSRLYRVTDGLNLLEAAGVYFWQHGTFVDE